MLELTAAALILTGLTIIAAALFLLRRARRIGRIALKLIAINEQLHFDPIALLRRVGPLLRRAGISGCAWELDWFGTPIHESFGAPVGPNSRHRIETPEINLTATFYYRNLRGENRFFGESVRETMLLLLKTDLWMKTGIVHATMAEMEQLTLFAAHDLKNIAQYLQLTADQLAVGEPENAAPPPDRDQVLLARLRQTFPVMRRRAESILRTLGHGGAAPGSPAPYRLPEMLRQLCRFHDLPAIIRGEGAILTPAPILETIFDNILKNYADLARRRQPPPRLEIIIAGEQGGCAISFVDITLPTAACDYERLFEPFYTTGPQGGGIGLYQARRLARLIGGDLTAGPDRDGRPCFHLAMDV